MRRLQRMREEGRDRGLSLAELIVTMGIVAIVMAVAAAMFVSTLRQARVATAKTNASSSARVAMEALTRDLRVAIAVNGTNPAIVSASPRAVTFYASRGVSSGDSAPTPTLVSYEITTDCLRRTLTPIQVESDNSVTPLTARTTCVSRGTFNSGGAAMFTWYTSTPAVGTASVVTVPAAGTTDQDDLGRIAAVDVSVTVGDPQSPTVPGVSVAQRVTMTNLTAALLRGA